MTFCGLDFGTSNSAIGTFHNGRVQLCPLEDNNITMPTAIFYHSTTRECTFGRQAISDYLDGEPGRLMRSIKSLLGTALMEESTPVKGVNYAFKSILSDYIAMLKFRAESWIKQPIDSVVHGRPVRFVERNGNQNQQAEDTLRQILVDVGFKNIVFQYEPLAAAHSFTKETKSQGIALIIDMGGGTTDFTVINMDKVNATSNLPEEAILTNYGVRLGGTNFDKSISLAKVMPTLGYQANLSGNKGLSVPNWIYHMLSDWSEINFLYSRKQRNDINWVIRNGSDRELMNRLKDVIERQLGHRICHDVEVAKIKLSENSDQQINLDYLEYSSNVTLNTDELPGILESEITIFTDSILETLRLCGLSPLRVDTICLTGGSTNLGAIRHTIRKLFPNVNVFEQDKFSSVCRGLTLEGLHKFS